MSKIIHIGYGDSAAGCLRTAIKCGMPGEQVVVSRDDFTQGPIDECLIDGGQSQRSNYWENLKTLHSGMEDVKSHYVSTLKALDEIQDESTVVLWIGDSAHDILASAWLLSYFSEKNFNWKYMDLKSVTSGSENILVNVAMLSPRNIYKLYVNIRNMDADKILIFKNIWKKLASENSAYRIYENGKVLSVPEDYHDTIILSFISKKEQLLGKLMGTIMGHSEHRLSDTTIESRLLALKSKKKVKIDLNLVNVFTSKVRLK